MRSGHNSRTNDFWVMDTGGDIVFGSQDFKSEWGRISSSAFTLPGGVTIRVGSGVPSNSVGSNGDLYIDKDATASAYLYTKSAGAWGLLPTAGGSPSGAAGGVLGGSFPNPSLASGVATGAALGTDVVTWDDHTKPFTVSTSRLLWRGQSYYLHGANLPWVNFSEDFGGGSSTGMSKAANLATASTNLTSMYNAGMRTVRWWVFTVNKSNYSNGTLADTGHYLYSGTRGTGTSLGNITGASYAGGVITYTLASDPSTLLAGQSYITVTGVTPSGYNQSVPILVYAVNHAAKTVQIGNQFSDPGSYSSGGAMATGADTWSSHYFVIDSAGYPIGIQDNVIADFDAAVSLLESIGMRAIFTLFNGPDSLPQSVCWNDDRGQRALIDTLSLLFQRYRNSSAILGWELGNEWDTYVNNFWPIVGQQATNKLIAMFANAVHSASKTATASVSCGNAGLIAQFRGLGLDFYGASWYQTSNASLTPSYADYNMAAYDATHYISTYSLDAPVLVEEAMVGIDSGGNNTGSGLANATQVQTRLQYFRDNGYVGCLGWSAAGAGDGMNIDYTGATNFASGKTDIGPGSTA
jgi:hypothetical protein